jgi:integrase/recombinase XerD
MALNCEECGKEFIPCGGNRKKCSKCVKPYGREDRGLNDILISIKNKSQRKTLNNWVNERVANGNKLKTTVCRIYTLKKFAEFFNKPFEKVTKQDVINLLSKKEFNKVYHKKSLKQFFKWLKQSDNPEIISWIKVKKGIDEVKPERKILTDEQILKIINATTTQRDRTILQILVENPTRPRDICNLKIKDVKEDEYGFELNLGSKSVKGRRTIRLINTVPDMQLYLKNHPFKYNQEAPLFFQLSRNKYGQPIGWCALHNMLSAAVKRAKLKRDVTLYDFRRTSTTNLLRNENYTPSEIQVMGGWASIRMLDVYGKVTSEMVNDKKLRLSGMKKSEQHQKKDLLKPITCPRCEHQNSIGSVACKKCWLPLKKETIDLKEKVINKSIEWDKPMSKNVVKEILKEMVKKGELTL